MTVRKEVLERYIQKKKKKEFYFQHSKAKSSSELDMDITTERLEWAVTVSESRSCELERHCISGQEIGSMFAARASLGVATEMLRRRWDSIAAAAAAAALGYSAQGRCARWGYEEQE
jgi:hypothetical protein